MSIIKGVLSPQGQEGMQLMQELRLFLAILPTVTHPSQDHMLIKYAHVLICICAGEGSSFHDTIIMMLLIL